MLARCLHSLNQEISNCQSEKNLHPCQVLPIKNNFFKWKLCSKGISKSPVDMWDLSNIALDFKVFCDDISDTFYSKSALFQANGKSLVIAVHNIKLVKCI